MASLCCLPRLIEQVERGRVAFYDVGSVLWLQIHTSLRMASTLRYDDARSAALLALEVMGRVTLSATSCNGVAGALN